ncbi:MAG: hypothetical protein VKK05_03285 [Synechococcus sp.]|nr:hypothetical protein [Synechococcus sp.]
MAAAGRRSVLLAACGLVLAGCSGTPWGEQLSRSFSAPTSVPTPAPGPLPKPKPPGSKPPAAKTTDPKTPPPAAQPLPQAPSSPSKPAPYRITIQLPSADPAAPAEAVTEALRAAGLRFEVEMIERISAPAAPAGAPTVTPAPAPR